MMMSNSLFEPTISEVTCISFQQLTFFLCHHTGDGVLNFTEFVDLMINDKPELEADLELIEAFRCFDTADTGIIGGPLLNLYIA